jgi:hypothetical protein
MLCPNCGKDYRDVPDGHAPGLFYRGDEHFGKSERRFGYLCNNCGVVSEFITRPTGFLYLKREQNKEDNQINMFGSSESAGVTKKLLDEIELIYNKTKGLYRHHLSSIIKETTLKLLLELIKYLKKELGEKGNKAA